MKSKELISRDYEWKNLKRFFQSILEVLTDRPPLSKADGKARKLAIWLAQYMFIFGVWVIADCASYQPLIVSVLIVGLKDLVFMLVLPSIKKRNKPC